MFVSAGVPCYAHKRVEAAWTLDSLLNFWVSSLVGRCGSDICWNSDCIIAASAHQIEIPEGSVNTALLSKAVCFT